MAEQFQSTPKENDEKPQLSAPLDLSQLRRLCEQATPEPWELCGKDCEDSFEPWRQDVWLHAGGEHLALWLNGSRAWKIVDTVRIRPADAEFIAAARTALPVLLDLVERLAEALKEVVGIMLWLDECDAWFAQHDGLDIQGLAARARAVLGEIGR